MDLKEFNSSSIKMKRDKKNLISVSMINDKDKSLIEMATYAVKKSPAREKKQESLKSSFEFFGESEKNKS